MVLVYVTEVEVRFFFGQDNSCHWYLVPAEKRAEWDAWTALDEDDENGWVEPEWVVKIDGHPCSYTFEKPNVEI